MAYRINHLASECYLAQWADSYGRLCVVTPPNPASEQRKPAKVGWRAKLWSADPRVRRIVEQNLNRIESDAADLLRRIDDEWPIKPGSPPWVALSLFIAIHLWRNPFGLARLRDAGHLVLANEASRYEEMVGTLRFEQFVAAVSSDAYRANVYLRNLPRAGSLIGSMHWTLMDFDRPLLATSDVPVTVVPILDVGNAAPVQPLPIGSLLDCEEIRFPLNPAQALVMTWLDRAGPPPRVQGDDELAAHLNRAVIRQADRQWFHIPARRPTTLLASDLGVNLCPQIGRLVHAGYGTGSARASARRSRTTQLLRAAIDSDEPRQMFWVKQLAA